MSRENIEIVGTFVVADLDKALTYVDPDIVWNPIEEPPTQGHDAVRAYWERWETEWDVYEEIPEECIDIGDRVVVTVLIRGRGRGSGIEIDARFYELYKLRDGKIVRMDEFPDHAQALDAAGLSK
jgi:ketosteroid isomerase-like protein